jgi:polysaccharide deacetylase family protein (PEP-CTERM system associated)
MTPEQALEELSKAKDILEQISGVQVYGHRAPAFSISKNTPWAFDVIKEAGFTYDSSIMPISSEYHGWNNFPKEIVNLETSNGPLIEFPISLLNIFGRDLPVSGGSYLRLLPYWFLKRAFSKINKNQHNMIYIHPYELDREDYPDYYFEELNKKDFKTRLKLKTNFINRKKSINKIAKLLENFDYKTVIEIIEDQKDMKKISLKDLN